jgi:hypothetical protein
MEAQFWIDSWHIGGYKTSFHRRDIHPYLTKHFPPATLHGKRVLVPLCGKTLDLLYFQDHASHIIGVELVEQAVQQFFAEHNLPFVQRGNRYEAERLTLICGDFFALTSADVGPIDLIYARASLVARALAQEPKLLVLDEPTNHLDIRYQLEILNLVRGLGVTTLVTLHDLNLAAAYCHRLYLLANGRIVMAGAPEVVLTPQWVRDVYGVETLCFPHPSTGRLLLAFEATG